MPTPRSRSYGIIVSPKGVPTLCLFGTNKLATINPNTMEIREYALPDAASRPRRIAIVGDEVWYSDFSRGFLGRYNIATGEHKEWASPSGPQSQPYGIVFAKGAIWYNELFCQAEYYRALRSQDGKISELGNPRRRRHRPQDGRDAGRQPGDGQQPHQSSWIGRDQIAKIRLHNQNRPDA